MVISRLSRFVEVAFAGVFLLAAPAGVGAQNGASNPLIVGTKEAPPFAIKRADGTWSGIAVELWTGIASDLGYDFEFRETDLPGLLDGVASGQFDAGVAALTVTPGREAVVDFSHPFHVSGLGIAVRTEQRRGWLAVVEQFFSFGFLKLILGLTALLFLVGSLVWFFEHRHNPDQFGGHPAAGLGASFWWSAVTMTTVGYGDKAPQTLGGRVVALLWMFTALIVISSFTAAVTASLTVGSLQAGISGPDDLETVRIGTVANSTSTEYLDREGLPYRADGTAEEALSALAAGEVDAVVYDAPILRYDVRRGYSGRLTVLPIAFDRQLYAIALPVRSPLREGINQALLDRTSSPDWERLMDSYLGATR